MSVIFNRFRSASRRSGAEISVLALVAGLAALAASPAHADGSSSEILAGDYLKIGLSDKGTLGVGGNTSPGVLYDGTGSGVFNEAYDYLTPGAAFEGFTVSGSAGSAFNASNNNGGGTGITGILTSYNGVEYDGQTYDQRAVWTGALAGVLNITHDYAFNADGQQLNINTTIEALTDLTDLTFSRYIDPDATAAPGDSSSTTNVRGADGVPEEDLVYAEAVASKYVIGLYSNSDVTHNSAVTFWTDDTASYLAGTNVGDGDNTIGLGFDIGALLSGSKILLTYRYIFGADIGAAVEAGGGGGGAAPAEPPPPPPPPTIDTTAPYTIEQLRSGSVIPVFDGGVLTMADSGVLDNNFTVLSAGGTVDTAGHDLTLTGSVTGPGVLTKTGDGVLTLAGGTNSFAGLNITAGGVALGGPDVLGGAPIMLAQTGYILATRAMTVGSLIWIDPVETGAVNTEWHRMTLTGPLTGGGVLAKRGSGALVLEGPSDLSGLDIQEGSVLVGAPGSVGAANGVVHIGSGGSFGVTADMTLPQSFVSQGGQFDTGGHNVVMTGAVGGDSCFTKVGEGHLNLMSAGGGLGGACILEGQLSFNNQFTGDVQVAEGAIVSGGGHILGDLITDGILSPGNSPGRLVVSGSVTQRAGAALLLDIDGSTPGVGAGHHDTLVLTGADAVFTAGGTLRPVTRGITGAANNTYTPAIGDRFEVITAEGGVAGAFAQLVQPEAGLPENARFDVVYGSHSVILAVTPERLARIAGKLNGQAAGAALDTTRPDPAARPTAGATPVASRLAGLDLAEISQALGAVAGETHAAGLDALISTSRSLTSQTQDRLLQAPGADRRVWGQVSGARWDVDGDAYAEGYEADGLTLLVGADRQVGPGLTVGIAAAYGEATTDGGLMGEAKVFTYRGMAYGGWREGPTYVQAVAGFGQDRHKTQRRVSLTNGIDTLNAKAPGQSLFADVEAGRDMAVRGVAVTLAAGLSAERAERDAVSESGGQAALAFDEATREAVEARLGVRLTQTTALGGWRVTPQAAAFLTQGLGEESARLDARLDGASFETRAAAAGRTGLRLSAGLEAQLQDRTRISLDYRLNHNDKAQSHALAATVSVTW